MALPSNDINDLNRKRIIESTDVPGQPGIVVLNPDGTAVGAPVGGATSANQTNGSQKTQIVDGSGNVIGSTSNALDVNIKSGSSSGTQYTEGDTDASITGTAVMWEDTSDTLRPVSASKPLPVNIVSGSASGTEYTEGDVDATLTGTIAMAEGPSNTATPLQVDASGHLQMDVAAISTSVTVQDGGGSLTVDNNGTFAVQASLNAGTNNIGDVDVVSSALPTGASTLAEQQSQTTHLSTIAGDTTSIQTAVELLDDTVATDGSATPTKGILMAGQDGTNAQTISTNSSGHINIADGGNTITVDGTVGISGSVTVQDGGGSITIDNNGTFVVQENGAALTALQLIDDPIATDDTTTHSTGTTKVMGIGAVATPTDASVNANDIGMPAMSLDRRLNVDANLQQGDSDVAAGNPLQVTLANGTVPSHPVTNAGTFAVQVDGSALTALQLIDDTVYTDDTSTHSTGSSKGNLMMAAATPTDTAVNANDIGAIGMTNNREMYVSLRDISGTAAVTGSGTATGALRVELPTNGTGTVGLNAGTNAIGKLAANSGVDIGDVDVTSVIAGTGATNLGKAEDAGHNTGDTGVMALGVRSASPTDRSAGPTDGDYEPFALNEVGAIWVSETSSINGGDSTATASTADGSTALTNSAQVIKASAGKLTGYYIYNPNSSATYVNFYNTAAASVTVGTTNPLFNICIPATSAANLSGLKVTFSTAMSWSATTTGGGNTAPSTALEATCWYK